MKLTKDRRALRMARGRLKFMSRYFKLQVELARENVITPGLTWQQVYIDVCGAAKEWCDEAIQASRRDRQGRR